MDTQTIDGCETRSGHLNSSSREAVLQPLCNRLEEASSRNPELTTALEPVCSLRLPEPGWSLYVEEDFAPGEAKQELSARLALLHGQRFNQVDMQGFGPWIREGPPCH